MFTRRDSLIWSAMMTGLGLSHVLVSAGCGGSTRDVALASTEAAAHVPQTYAVPPVPSHFTLDNVREQAKALAAHPFEPPPQDLPESLRRLRYDAFRDIRFRTDHALWRDEGMPFEAQFFHRGFLSNQRVDIHVVTADGVEDVPFSTSLFDYGRNRLAEPLPSDLGFAGFRLHYPLNRADYHDELIVFLGASYFRVLGRDQIYGLSARGLAVDTALSSGEEFPFFRSFWLVKPARNAKTMTVYALLDSQRVTGAYRFDITPGNDTIVNVTASIYARERVTKLGIAPLTSMFLFGEATPARFNDFRPEVHDSDGLLIANGNGEWIFRPLRNPESLATSAYTLQDPRGFGLLQRDRDFDHYQDLETLYQKRPSMWVEPTSSWGRGRVELVEIPSDSEGNDNIVAYWLSDETLPAGGTRDVSYRLHSALELEGRPPGGHVLSTRHSFFDGHDETRPRGHRFIVDFGGGPLNRLEANAPVEAVVSLSTGQVAQPTVQHNPFNRTWRVFFDLPEQGDGDVDMRAFLRRGDDVLTETWSYVWTRR